MKIVVIGSGMAGLTVAAYLSRAGHTVTVFEQYHQIGGVTATIRESGYGWDIGPLLLDGFGPGDMGTRILRELGVLERLGTIQGDRGIVFPDFDLWKPVDYRGPYWRRERLRELFPDESDGLDRYYEFYDRFCALIALARKAEHGGISSLITRLKMWNAYRRFKEWEDWSAEAVTDYFFQSPRLKAVFTAILADMVVKPSEFMGLGVPLFNIETAFDKRIPVDLYSTGPGPAYRYIAGGCGNLVAAVAGALKESGGRIFTNAAVKRISIERKKTGVHLEDGHFEEADLVLATGGARETFYNLIGRELISDAYARRIDDQVPMESVLMVQLGIDFDPARYQQAALCYYYGTYDIESGVQRCRDGAYHEGKDGFLIYIPSYHSPELAPEGCHSVTVYTIAPNKLDTGSWSERREWLADKLIKAAERYMPGLSTAKVRIILTPEDFQKRTHQHHHSFGGVAPIMGKKNPTYRTPIRNLWFLGSQSESCGGVLGVMMGARKVARLIDRRS
jgi:phytoene desaturase